VTDDSLDPGPLADVRADRDLDAAGPATLTMVDGPDRLPADRPIEPIRGQDATDHGRQELHDAYATALGPAEQGACAS
jgi:hypothetical protein